MRFEFLAPHRIVFGPGVAPGAPDAAASLGTRAFVITGGDPDRAAWLFKACAEKRLPTVQFSVRGEPTLAAVRAGTAAARGARCDVIIAVGGGSVLDSGKAIAAVLSNGGDPLDYLEVIGGGQTLRKPALPCIAVPTTAGTGAEVTRNAVLASSEHGVKASLRSPHLLPTVAVIDPELMQSMPPGVTAATGLDALTQLIEPFVSPAATPLTDHFCREGLSRARALRRAYANGADLGAREDMALASLLGGFALAHAKLGVVHGCAAALGAKLHAPHGAICARLLPYAMTANVAALSERAPGSPAIARYEQIARILTGMPEATIADGIRWVHQLVMDCRVPALREHGLTEDRISMVVAEAQRASSTKGNPIPLSDAELDGLLRQAL